MRASFAIALAVICTVLPFAGQFAGDRSGGWLMIDFRAYYCASLAQRLGRDPYFTASVHECESKTPAPYYRAPKNVTVPAPYPPYALAFFAPLTFLPFAVAAILWWIALALSILLAAYALARIARQPMLVAWGALVLSLGLTSFWSGNVMPVAFAALIVAALAVQRGRLAIAVPALAIAMVEPQVALPAAIGLFVACSRVRVALILAAALLGVISVASCGVAQTLSYLTAVAPAHALSEVSRDNQYSLSTVLAALGVPDVSAALAGSISYVIVSAVGVLVALRLARRFDDPSLNRARAGGLFGARRNLRAYGRDRRCNTRLPRALHAGSCSATLAVHRTDPARRAVDARGVGGYVPSAGLSGCLHCVHALARRPSRGARSGGGIVCIYRGALRALFDPLRADGVPPASLSAHRSAPRRVELAPVRTSECDEPSGDVAATLPDLGGTDYFSDVCSAIGRAQGGARARCRTYGAWAVEGV